VKPKGTLSIRSEDFSVELKGDVDFVTRGWDSLREDLVDRSRANPIATGSESATGAKLPGGAGGWVWIAVLHDLYKTMYVQQRSVLQRSALSKCIDVSRVARLYVQRKDRSMVEEIFPFGRTAWSELTESGQSNIGGQD